MSARPLHRRHLRPLTWLALLAVLALALLPTVSRALAWAQHGDTAWAEICTPQGPRLVALNDGPLASEQAPGHAPAQAAVHLEHCPLCSLSSAPLSPPPAALAMTLQGRDGTAPPPAFLHAPSTLHAWRSAQPRGPPTHA